MLHGKQFSDWGTPRPASARSSPSLNDPLEMIKRGIIKSGNDSDKKTGFKLHSKEHAIDSSTNDSQLISQNVEHGVTSQNEVPPKSIVQRMQNERHAKENRNNFVTQEQDKHSVQLSKLNQESRNHMAPSSKEMLWATLKDNKQSNPQSCYLSQANPGITQDHRLHHDMVTKKASDSYMNKFDEKSQYSSSVEYFGQGSHLFSGGICLYENKSLDSVRISSEKANHVSGYQEITSKHSSSANVQNARQPYSNIQSNKHYKSSEYNTGISSHYSMQPSLSHVNSLTSASSLNPVNAKSNAQSIATGKWDHVMNAKDDLIRQKDIIIERQKQTIEQMQQHINEIEERFNQNSFLLMSQRKDEQKLELERKDSQCQISHLKAQLQQISATKQDEIEKLQRKLGATEYELQKLEKGFKDVGRGQANEISVLKRKIEERDVVDKNLKKSLDALQDDLKKERRKAQSLQQYLHDLPTAEEHKKSLHQIKDIKSEKQKLEDVIENLEKQLRESKDQIKQKERLLQEERASKEDIERKTQRLSDTLVRYKEREKDGPVTLEEYDEIKWENERIKAECDRIKKLLEQKHKKMKLLHQQSQNTTKALEERLGQEEDTINTLRNDIESKDSMLEDLRTSVRQVTSKNQDLMREIVTLKEILSEFDQLTSKEVQQAHLRVHKEVSICVAEIKYLIQLCCETAEGKDPNMSTLLGIKGQPEEILEDSEDVNENIFSTEFARIKLKRIRELRGEIDKLRTFISDKYAEEVGNNCITQ